MKPAHAARLLTLAAVMFAAAWSVPLALLHVAGTPSVLDRLEASLLDLRFLAGGPRAAPADVLIVAVDEATVRWAKAFPLPRRVMADLVARLFADGAAAVALDFLFLDPSTSEADAALAEALRQSRSAIAVAAAFAPTAPPPGPDGILQAEDFELPTSPLRESAALGFVNVASDLSGIPRHVPMLLGWNGRPWASLALRLVGLAHRADPAFTADAVEIGGVRSALDLGRGLALRFYGPERTIGTISAARILTTPTRPDLLAGAIVLVGATAEGSSDRFPTPFDAVLPGVEVLATAVANLHRGEALVRDGSIRRLDGAVAVALSLAVALLLTRRRIEWGVAGVAGSVVGLGAVAMAAFTQGFWLALALPLAAMLPVGLVTAAARLGLGRWTEGRMQRDAAVLRAFHAPAIAARLAADPDFLSRPIEREVAVLFVDLTGYTGVAETIGPAAAGELLREFHAAIEEETRRGGGIVASYMGDGAMMIWGIAEADADDAARAVETAVALCRRTQAWLARLPAGAGRPRGVKLGGQFGPVVLTRLGHATHQHITAIGDTVNSAARLMEVAAEAGCQMALGAALVEVARRRNPGMIMPRLSEARAVAIRGRAQPLSVCFWVEADEGG